MSGETKAAGEAVEAGLAFAATLTEAGIWAMDWSALNFAVARAIGWTEIDEMSASGRDSAHCTDWPDELQQLPNVTGDHADAWRLLEMIRALGWQANFVAGVVYVVDGEDVFSVEGDDAKIALARAYLLARRAMGIAAGLKASTE